MGNMESWQVVSVCWAGWTVLSGVVRHCLQKRSIVEAGRVEWQGVEVNCPEGRKSYRFVLTCWGSRGDVQPLLVLANELIRQGHSVKLVIGHEMEDLACKFGLSKEVAVYHNPCQVDDIGRELMRNPIAGFRQFFGKVFPPFVDQLWECVDEADAIIAQMAPIITQPVLWVAEVKKKPLFFTAHDPMVLSSPEGLVFSTSYPTKQVCSVLHIWIVSLLFGM